MADNKKIKELENLIAKYEQLTKTKYDLNINTSNLKQVESQIRVVTGALKEAERETSKIGTSFSDLKKEVEGIVGEMGNWGTATSKATKAFRNIADITQKLTYDEKGLSELSKKDLERLQKQIKINKEELIVAAKSIQAKYRIKKLSEENIKNAVDIKDEEAAILRGYLGQFSVVDDINKQKTSFRKKD